jgi:hypothetical protein
MAKAYDDYLKRFSASRGGRAVGRYTVANGILVPLLSRSDFEQRCRQLEDKLLMHRHLQRRDYTVPFALEKVLGELRAELLLPDDYLLASFRGRAAA